MSFSDHKITAFAHRIADLPDQPNLPADELKARFDSSPEELRVAHNAICDDAARLEARVEGIVVDTFGDTIDKEMLSDELAAELDAKATQTALAAEQTARESADTALSGRVTTLETAVPQKSEVYFGTYTGTGSYPRTISLGFTPKAVLIGHQNGLIAEQTAIYSTLMLQGYSTNYCAIVTNGFQLYSHNYNQLNYNGARFFYIAFR